MTMKRKKKIIMKRKVKPEKTKKLLHPNIMSRKDGKANCYVCYKPLYDIRELREMKGTPQEGTNYYLSILHRVSSTLVTIGRMGRKFPLYRHNKCEPGSNGYNKNKYLRKQSKKFDNNF